MTENLGNVVGLLLDTSEPAKRYVLWAHVLNPTYPEEVVVKAWSPISSSWVPVDNCNNYWLSAVLAVNSNTPPVSPNLGDAYIIASGSTTGVWVGHENNHAVWLGHSWQYTLPKLNSIVRTTANVELVFNGNTWVVDEVPGVNYFVPLHGTDAGFPVTSNIKFTAGFGIDTETSGVLKIGNTTASSILIRKNVQNTDTGGYGYFDGNSAVVAYIAANQTHAMTVNNGGFNFRVGSNPGGTTALSFDATHLNITVDSSFVSTGFLQVPKGTTAQASGFTTEGMIRFNTQTINYTAYFSSGGFDNFVFENKTQTLSNKTLITPVLWDASHISIIDTANRRLQWDNSFVATTVADWSSGKLVLNADASSALEAVTYQQLLTYLPLSGGTLTGALNMNGHSIFKAVLASSDTVIAFDTEGRSLYDDSANISIDFQNRFLNYFGGSQTSVSYGDGFLYDNTAVVSIAWNARWAINSSNVTIADWSGSRLTLNADATSALHAVTYQQLQAHVVGLWDDRGSYNASANTYPSTGGSGTAGAILKGDIWTISVIGTLGGTAVQLGDTVRALVDSPGSTSSNWALGEHDLGYTPVTNVLNSAYIFVGNSSNVATGMAVTGDVTFNNTGVTTVGNGRITNAMLVNSTISGISLGGNLSALTIGTGLSGSSYNGSGAVTIAIDSTVATLTGAQALSNKTGLISQWTNDSAYLTGNQTITLSGDVTGSGATTITTAIAATIVTGKLLTGYVSSLGVISPTDSILSSIQKLGGITGTNSINAKLYGIVGDGITDDTVNMNAAFAAALAVGKDLFIPAGTYFCNTITSAIVSGAPNKILRLETNTTSKLRIYGETGTVITTSMDQYTLFYIYNKLTDLTIENIFFQNTHAVTINQTTGISMAGTSANNIKNPKILKCRFEGFSTAILMQGVVDITIDKNIYESPLGHDNAQNSSQPAVYVWFADNANGQCYNAKITNNTANGYSGPDILTTTTLRPMDGFVFGIVYGLEYTGNTTKNFCEEHILLKPAVTFSDNPYSVLIYGNHFYQSIPTGSMLGGNPMTSNYGVRADCNNVTVVGNEFIDYTQAVLLYPLASPTLKQHGYRVSNNKFYSPRNNSYDVHEAIKIQGSTTGGNAAYNICVDNNYIDIDTITLQSSRAAIAIYNSDKVNVYANTVVAQNVTLSGFTLNAVLLNTLTNVTLKNNSTLGITTPYSITSVAAIDLITDIYTGGFVTAPAWTTSGIGLVVPAATYTDTTSSGTVASQYAHKIGIPTFAASSATTYSTAGTLFIDKPPTTGTNVTNSNVYALVLGGDLGFQTGAIFKFGTIDAQGMNLRTSATSRYTISGLGFHAFSSSATSGGTTPQFLITQPTNTGGSAGILTITGAATTNQTTATEVNDILFDLSATKNWALGAITTQRDFYIKARTYTATGSSTFTTGATFTVSGAPTGSGGVTITNPLAIWVQAGLSRFDGGIGVGSTSQFAVSSSGIITAGTWNGTVIGSAYGGAGSISGLLKANGSGTVSVVINSDLPVMTSTVGGAVPTPPNDNTKVLLGDATWGSAGTGTVTTVSVTTANGISGTVATASTTPAITLSLGAITPTTIVTTTSAQTPLLGLGTTPTAVLHMSTNLTLAFPGNLVGYGLRVAASTFTDSSSTTGTITSTFAHSVAAPTFNATNSGIIYTTAGTLYIAPPSATGTNVTNTNIYALVLGGDLGFQTGATAKFGPIDNQGLNIRTNATTRYALSAAGTHTLTASVAASGVSNMYTLTAPAHTGQTANSEVTDVNFNLSAAMGLADGTVANMRAFRIQGRTYNKTTTSATLTKVSTLSVTGPTMGTGVTGTTQAAIECDGNFLLPTIGNKIYIKTGTNASTGSAVLVGGTVTVNNTSITANTLILVSIDGVGTLANVGTPYEDSASRVAGTSFTLKSTNVLDSSTITWLMIEPAP